MLLRHPEVTGDGGHLTHAAIRSVGSLLLGGDHWSGTLLVNCVASSMLLHQPLPCLFSSLPSVDLRLGQEPLCAFSALLHVGHTLLRSIWGFPQFAMCLFICCAVATTKVRHFPQEKLPSVVANYDVIEENKVALDHVCADGAAIHVVLYPHLHFFRCVDHDAGESQARM